MQQRILYSRQEDEQEKLWGTRKDPVVVETEDELNDDEFTGIAVTMVTGRGARSCRCG